MFLKRILFLALFVPTVVFAECYWINGQFACTLGNNPTPYVPPPAQYVPSPGYYYAPPIIVVPPITPGQMPLPPSDWGNSKISPLPGRRNIWGD
jgi:hypothetical protein